MASVRGWRPGPVARFSSAAAPGAGSASPRKLARVNRRHRLSRSRDFDAVYRQGRSVSTRFLVLYWFARDDEADAEGPRLGLAVPKAVGSAVVRNRVKRKLREIFRAHSTELARDSDYVLVVRPGFAEADESRGHAWLTERVEEILGKAAAGRGTRASARSTSSAGPSGSSGADVASTTRPARSTRSMPCAGTGSSAGRCSPAGGCSAAIPGVAAGSTTSNDPSLLDPHPARRPPPQHPGLVPRLGRPQLGLVDRGADRDGAGPARSTDRQADPLDAEPAASRAADEGAPEEVQDRQEAPAGRA